MSIILMKFDPVAKVYYLSFDYGKVEQLKELSSSITESTMFVVDSDDYHTIVGVEMLGGLQIIDESFRARKIKVVSSNNFVDIIFTESQKDLDEATLDGFDSGNELIRNRVRFWVNSQHQLVKISIDQSCIGGVSSLSGDLELVYE